MRLPQADEWLPANVMQVIGAARTYAQRMQFFTSVPNTLMIAVLFYNDSTAIQGVFPTVYHWVGFILGVVVPMGVMADRVVLHPAQIIYNAHQGSRANRNPGYRFTKDSNDRIRRIEDHLGIPQPDGGEEVDE